MTSTISVSLIDVSMSKRLANGEAVAEQALAETAVQTETVIEQAVAPHTKTGAIERSIFKARTDGGWDIGHDTRIAPHARWVHDGARPHVIMPKDRKALRWPVPGGFAFAKKVNHPGYAGDAWLERAAAQAPVIFERALKQRLQGV